MHKGYFTIHTCCLGHDPLPHCKDLDLERCGSISFSLCNYHQSTSWLALYRIRLNNKISRELVFLWMNWTKWKKGTPNFHNLLPKLWGKCSWVRTQSCNVLIIFSISMLLLFVPIMAGRWFRVIVIDKTQTDHKTFQKTQLDRLTILVRLKRLRQHTG